MRTLTSNDILVPIIRLDDAFEDGRVSKCQCFFSTRFIVKTAPISLAHVGLISNHLKCRLLHSLAAQLNSPVHKSSALKFNLQPQVEVLELPGCAKKIVVHHRLFQSPAD